MSARSFVTAMNPMVLELLHEAPRSNAWGLVPRCVQSRAALSTTSDGPDTALVQGSAGLDRRQAQRCCGTWGMVDLVQRSCLERAREQGRCHQPECCGCARRL